MGSVWLSNKSAKQFTLNSTRWYAAAFALRQRMLNFVQNLQYYMMFEVIEPNWQLFESNMDTVSQPNRFPEDPLFFTIYSFYCLFYFN